MISLFNIQLVLFYIFISQDKKKNAIFIREYHLNNYPLYVDEIMWKLKVKSEYQEVRVALFLNKATLITGLRYLL